MKNILFALSLLFATTQVAAAELCLGVLDLQCKEETVTTQLTASAILLPDVVASSEVNHVVRFEVLGPATIVNSGTVVDGDVLLTSPTRVTWRQLASETSLTGVEVVLDSNAFITDVVRVKLSIVDPNGNTALVLVREFNAVNIIGFEHKSVPFFNPSTNDVQFSILRLINESADDGVVTIRGTDDTGMRSGTVEALIPANGAIQLNSQELEFGSARVNGSLGDGTGKWRLTVDSDFVGLKVQALVRNNVTGTISTVSALTD